MKLKLHYFLVTLFLLGLVHVVNGQLQEVVATAGGSYRGCHISVSFTLGEVGVLTLENEERIVTQGFHQPKLVVTAINESADLTINIQAYPNPVTEYLHLVTSEILPTGSTYQLFNISGALVEEKPLEGTTTEIKFQSLVSATYFLKVVQGEQTVKSFKIIKN